MFKAAKIGKKILGFKGRGKKDNNGAFRPSVAFVPLKLALFGFTHFLLGKTVGCNGQLDISRQLSLIGQNYGTLRMKCVWG